MHLFLQTSKVTWHQTWVVYINLIFSIFIFWWGRQESWESLKLLSSNCFMVLLLEIDMLSLWFQAIATTLAPDCFPLVHRCWPYIWDLPFSFVIRKSLVSCFVLCKPNYRPTIFRCVPTLLHIMHCVDVCTLLVAPHSLSLNMARVAVSSFT